MAVLRWIWASYEVLTLWQWAVGLAIGGGGLGVMHSLQATTSWPFLVKVLVAAVIAFVWLTLLAFSRRSSQPKEGSRMESKQDDSPGAQQGHAGGDLAQSAGGHAINARDQAQVNIYGPAQQGQSIAPVIEGVVIPNISIKVYNPDTKAHQFRVVFHGVSGAAGTPRIKEAWLPWNCGNFQMIGPRQSGMIQIAQVDGEDRNVGRIIRFIHDKGRQYDGRLSEYVAFGGQLQLDLELQSEALIDFQCRRIWTLDVDSAGKAAGFVPA